MTITIDLEISCALLNEKSRELGFKNPDLVAASLNLSDFTSVKYAANERSISALIEFQDALWNRFSKRRAKDRRSDASRG